MMTLMLTVKGKRKGKGGTPKPPPIFNNITKMLTNLKSVIKSDHTVINL